MFVNTTKYIMCFAVIVLALPVCSGSADGATTTASAADSMQQQNMSGVEMIPDTHTGYGIQSPLPVNVRHYPEDDQLVSVNLVAVMISFDQPVDADSVSLQSLTITPAVNMSINKLELATNNSVSYDVIGVLKENTTYTAELSGIRDSGGLEIPALTWHFITGSNVETTKDMMPPTAPANLRSVISPIGVRVYLTWDASTDNVGVTGYRVIRNDLVIANDTKTAFVDRTVSENTIYRYVIQAYDAAGNVATSDTYTLNIPPASDAGLPTPPGDVRFSLLTNAQVTIRWNPSDDNAGISAYVVFRDSTLLAMTSSTFYSDSNVTAGAIYKYSIVALDYDGNLSFSDPFELNVPPLNDKTAIITWSNPVRNEDDSCSPGIERNVLFYGKSSGDYTHDSEIDLYTEASCNPVGYDNDCNTLVMGCEFRTAELAANEWYIALQSRDVAGLSSPLSNELVVRIK